jgi:ribosomal protein L32
MFINRTNVHRAGLPARRCAVPKNRTSHADEGSRRDPVKLKRARKAPSASTETQTVDRTLDLAVSDCERNRLTEEAHRRFLKSGILIRDIYENPFPE